MDRENYYRHYTAKAWLKFRQKDPGYSPYTHSLCDLIGERVPTGSTLLEVAIGTGIPFADYFQKMGYTVYGIDLTPELIEVCRKTNPRVSCEVGKADALPYTNQSFDCVYCFNASFYFPNLINAIDEMLRVVRPGGLVVFDLMNRNNEEIQKLYNKILFSNTTKAGKILRIINNLRKIMLRQGVPVWDFVVEIIPTYPESIYKHFKQKNTDFSVLIRNDDGSLARGGRFGSFRAYSRLVFVIVKKTNPDT